MFATEYVKKECRQVKQNFFKGFGLKKMLEQTPYFVRLLASYFPYYDCVFLNMFVFFSSEMFSKYTKHISWSQIGWVLILQGRSPTPNPHHQYHGSMLRTCPPGVWQGRQAPGFWHPKAKAVEVGEVVRPYRCCLEKQNMDLGLEKMFPEI